MLLARDVDVSLTFSRVLGLFTLSALVACGAGPHEPVTVQLDATSAVVLPGAVELAPHHSLRFLLAARDAERRALPPGSVTWEATGGTIDHQGVYIAGIAPGDYAVRAVSGGAPIAAARVRIVRLEPDAPAGQTGVPIRPGESIQTAVDRSPPRTTFLLKAGVHLRQSVVPKDGMTFVGEPGAVLDGGLAVAYAFHGRARDVSIRGLLIERYAPGAQMGAVKAGGHAAEDGTHGWTIERCEIRYNEGGGVRIGHATRVLANKIHHNSQIGIVGRGDDVLVEGNEIAWNNWEREYDYGWEAGGAKFVKTRNLVVRDNWSHDNWGPGLWTDIDNIDALIEGNRVENNADSGIFHEVSYRAVIRNNTVRGNGFDKAAWGYGAGILVAHSPDVEVYGNVVEDNYNGIIGMQQARGRGDHGPHELRNLRVHDNRIVQRRGQWAAGVVQDVGDRGVFARGLRFEANRYALAGDGHWFVWDNGSHRADDWRRYGHDATGTFER